MHSPHRPVTSLQLLNATSRMAFPVWALPFLLGFPNPGLGPKSVCLQRSSSLGLLEEQGHREQTQF